MASPRGMNFYEMSLLQCELELDNILEELAITRSQKAAIDKRLHDLAVAEKELAAKKRRFKIILKKTSSPTDYSPAKHGLMPPNTPPCDLSPVKPSVSRNLFGGSSYSSPTAPGYIRSSGPRFKAPFLPHVDVDTHAASNHVHLQPSVSPHNRFQSDNVGTLAASKNPPQSALPSLGTMQGACVGKGPQLPTTMVVSTKSANAPSLLPLSTNVQLQKIDLSPVSKDTQRNIPIVTVAPEHCTVAEPSQIGTVGLQQHVSSQSQYSSATSHKNVVASCPKSTMQQPTTVGETMPNDRSLDLCGEVGVAKNISASHAAMDTLPSTSHNTPNQADKCFTALKSFPALTASTASSSDVPHTSSIDNDDMTEAELLNYLDEPFDDDNVNVVVLPSPVAAAHDTSTYEEVQHLDCQSTTLTHEASKSPAITDQCDVDVSPDKLCASGSGNEVENESESQHVDGYSFPQSVSVDSEQTNDTDADNVVEHCHIDDDGVAMAVEVVSSGNSISSGQDDTGRNAYATSGSVRSTAVCGVNSTENANPTHHLPPSDVATSSMMGNKSNDVPDGHPSHATVTDIVPRSDLCNDGIYSNQEVSIYGGSSDTRSDDSNTPFTALDMLLRPDK